MVTIPISLQHPDLVNLWQAARNRLDRFDPERRGKVNIPDMSSSALLILESLLGQKPGKQIDLQQLEVMLIRQNIGDNLHSALTTLGFPPSAERVQQKAAASQRQQAMDQVKNLVQNWPESWALTWADWLFSSGQMAKQSTDQAVELVKQVRQLLDQLQPADPTASNNHERTLARNELAVRINGSSHALDDGSPLERCARRALWQQYAPDSHYHSGRDIWNTAGVKTDQVSAPVLVWRLPLEPDTALGGITNSATKAGVPVHLNQLALRQHPIKVNSTEPVLVVENPYLIEAAAERNIPRCVIATNGNPSSAVTLLIDDLIKQSVEVRYHGDFDSAGIAICRRMMERGCVPWKMDSLAYSAAVQLAEQLSITLPKDSNPCGPTPWDTALEHRFEEFRFVVHEELLVDGLFYLVGW